MEFRIWNVSVNLQSEGIEPLVVILPFNGYWYDYTELTAEERMHFMKR